VPLTARRDLHRSAGFAAAGARALELAGTDVDAVDHLDLYSCFPAAVRVQARELGITGERPLTITGGMTFAGGPLNTYVLQSTAAMADRLRGTRSRGLVTTISGMLTKQAVAVWSGDPPPAFRNAEVGDEARRATPTVEVVDEAHGEGRVVSWTVLHERGEPTATVAVVDLPRGARTVASGAPTELAVGEAVRVEGQSLR
jgi:acetyl-CoA C-acetyltransferase